MLISRRCRDDDGAGAPHSAVLKRQSTMACVF